MRFTTLRRARPADELPGLVGVARLDRRTRRLATRLRPGEVAVIDHLDLDRVAADALVAAGVAAVVNASPSISGRYPALGPEVIVAAGIPLLDGTGPATFDELREGLTVRLDGDTVHVGDRAVLTGVPQDAGTVATAMADARAGLAVQLEAFAANTMAYLETERDLLLDGVGVPTVRTRFDGRHCVVVVRGYDHRAQLERLGPYIREFRPVLVGVDGGADVLTEAGYTPDMVIGDLESVSDAALTGGAEVVAHTPPDGRSPGLARAEALGVAAVPFPSAATSEDVALLLADERGATVVVAVGTPATLAEFLDRGRTGTASTFLTRLRLGGKLVDAGAVTRFSRRGLSGSSLFFLAAAGLAALVAAVAVSTVGRSYLQILADGWNDLAFQLQRLFS